MKQQNTYDNLINEFFKALELRDFEQTDETLQKLRGLGSRHDKYRFWANYLAGVLEQEKNNDWAKAEEIFDQVLAEHPPKEIEALIYLSQGIAYQRLGRWPQCLEVSTKSVLLWEALEQPLRKATLYRQIAIACFGGYLAGDFSMEKLDEGRIKCQDALAILQSPSVTSNDIGLYEFDRELYVAMTYEVLGTIENCAGNFQLASEHFGHHLRIAEKRKSQFHIGMASWHLADTLHLSDLSQKNYILSLYDTAIAIFQHMHERLFEFQTLAAKGTLHRKLQMPADAIACYGHSLSLLENIRHNISSELGRRDFFAKVVKIHDNAILAESALGNSVAAFRNAELARSRTFADALNDPNNRVSGSRVVSTLSLSLQEQVPADCILLEFHCLGLLKPSGGQTSERQAVIDVLYPGARTLLFVVTNESVRVIDLEIDPNDLIQADLDKPVEEYYLTSQIRQALYQKLIAPAAHLLQNKRRLYIIPHGPLHYVPFHALIAPDGDTLLRADGPEIVYAPSATILFREMTPPAPVPGVCLAVGYNGDEGWQLRFAEDEAAHIAHMARGQALVGATSKKAALYAQAPNFQALHFSCHGEFDPDSPLDSRLHIGPNETLTGQEIMDNLRLNCNLVTLSACESGLSRVQRGDELYGLIRAFMYAGAPAIIATLWRVDERSTLIFAQKFYEMVQQELPYATALKAAQLYLRNLTRREAMQILSTHMADDESEDALVLADKYLKGLAPVAESTQSEFIDAASSANADDDEKIFAAPRYWAPFVLIGDPHIRRRAEQ
ncbi:MAG: CHAT domain-containing protein [Caldilineaceae bacterium]